MDYSDIINELSKRYNELQEEFKSVQDLVNDIDFVFDYTEEEQWLFYRMCSTMEEHCAALLRLIRFLKKQELEEQGHHSGQDAEEPHHNYRAMVEGQGIHIHDGNVPLDQCGCIKIKVGNGNATVQDPNESQPADTVPESLKELVGMQVVSVMPPGHKCQGCLFDRDYFRCEKKVELFGGYYLCLAPIPIVTE